MTSQEALEPADHAHEPSRVTPTVPLPPSGPTLVPDPDNVAEQAGGEGASCATV